MWLVQSRSERICVFSVANNVVPVEDILEMHNFDYTLTETARYNARIWLHYIAWDRNLV